MKYILITLFSLILLATTAKVFFEVGRNYERAYWIAKVAENKEKLDNGIKLVKKLLNK